MLNTAFFLTLLLLVGLSHLTLCKSELINPFISFSYLIPCFHNFTLVPTVPTVTGISLAVMEEKVSV